jgi:hypothetical protein
MISLSKNLKILDPMNQWMALMKKKLDTFKTKRLLENLVNMQFLEIHRQEYLFKIRRHMIQPYLEPYKKCNKCKSLKITTQ